MDSPSAVGIGGEDTRRRGGQRLRRDVEDTGSQFSQDWLYSRSVFPGLALLSAIPRRSTRCKAQCEAGLSLRMGGPWSRPRLMEAESVLLTVLQPIFQIPERPAGEFN